MAVAQVAAAGRAPGPGLCCRRHVLRYGDARGPPSPPSSEVSAFRRWKRLLVVLLLAGMTVCWVFATPLFGLSDEPAQVMKAAATVRGQFVGTPAGGPNTLVEIPEDLIGANRLPCFMFHRNVDAGCEPPLGHDTADVPEVTWVGYYPPLYYFLVGWPSLLFQGALAVYAMRLVAALLSAVLLGFAFLSAADARGRALLVPAVAALATPYVLVYMATVNPSGMEMASALCAWTSGVALANGPPPASRRRILVRFVVGLAVLAQVRDLGPLFAGVLVVAMVGWYGLRASWALLRRLAVRLIVAGVGACALFTTVWVFAVGNLRFVPNNELRTGDLELVWLSIRRFGADMLQIPGNFGWTDTSPPRWVSALGLFAIVSVALVGLRMAARRPRVVGIALFVFTFVFAVVVVALEARSEGILGQGRYWFPLVVGGVLVAAEAGGSRFKRPSRLLWSVVAGCEVVVNLVCFQIALDRFRFGLGEPQITAGWNPPGGGDPWPIVYGALTLVFTCWWWALGRTRGSAVPAGPSPPLRGPAVTPGPSPPLPGLAALSGPSPPLGGPAALSGPSPPLPASAALSGPSPPPAGAT